MITPLPDSQVHSNYHSVRYERKQSRADKSSAGSNHDTKNKHHTSTHINPSDPKRRYANSIKKKPIVNVVKDTTIDPCPFQLQRHRQDPSVPIQTIADVSIVGEPIFSPEPFDMSTFTNSYPHRRGRRIGQRRTHTVQKRLNSVAAYKQQLTKYVPPIVPTIDHTVKSSADDVANKNNLTMTPYVEDDTKPTSPAEDDDDKIFTTSESFKDDFLEDRNLQSVIIKPILACPSIVSKTESTIRHIHVSTVNDEDLPPPSSPTVIAEQSDHLYNIASLRIPDEFLCAPDDSPPTDADWKIAQTIPAIFPSPKATASISRINYDPLVDIPINHMKGEVIHDVYRAQVDTAAEATVTPFQHLLHSYRPYTETFKCPIRLVAALDSNATVSPLGEGLLHIPSEDENARSAMVPVRCYYSPHVSGTLLNENDLYGPLKSSIRNFRSM